MILENINANLKKLLTSIGSKDHFLTKALYFDKPRLSNWFVPYHQDLSISVKEKHNIPGYKNWTFKKGQYGVQPPSDILENTLTIRIHLDDTDENNGALRVLPSTHLKGVILHNKIQKAIASEKICVQKSGSIMLMRPLLLHASNKSHNENKRRVIHLEFSNRELAKPLKWLEYQQIQSIVST